MNCKLLVVDDQRVHRAFARAALSSAGWTVDEVPDGEAALRAIACQRYDLILLDIQMPGMDGYDTARAIRRGADPDIPILAYTALVGAAAEAASRAAGMDGHIVKPLPAADLAARLSAWAPSANRGGHDRLAATFGTAEVERLIGHFGEQLAEALARIDEPDGGARAHRIAGLAGTLGFPEVHAQWLALSEGLDAARADAAAVARRALRAIGMTTEREPSLG